MTRAAIRKFALPILRELVGDSARLFLNPCTRLTWWRIRQRRRRRLYKWTGIADMRVRQLTASCEALKSGDCTALEAADEVLKQLEERLRK